MHRRALRDASRQGEIQSPIRRLGIVLPAPPLWKGLKDRSLWRDTVQILCRFRVRRREWPALDRMSPSFAPNIAAAEDFVPAGASANISRNGTMLYCRERDRVLFVATRARLSA